jgi:predicted negative regulator of RcsB-dependent stress response
MSSLYLTEEEQLAAIVSWFKRYQRVLYYATIITILVAGGWYYWSSHVAHVQERRSALYERLMSAVEAKDDKLVLVYAQQLSKESGQTVYRDAAHLTLAHYFVSHAEWEMARNELQAVIRDGHTPAFKALARMRLSRILFFEKQYQQALEQTQQLVKSPGAQFMDLTPVHELQRDIKTMMT